VGDLVLVKFQPYK